MSIFYTFPYKNSADDFSPTLFIIEPKHLEQVDKKNHLLFFSSLNYDGNFEDNLEDKNVDVEKVVATPMKIEA